jgi:hypothetical protein
MAGLDPKTLTVIKSEILKVRVLKSDFPNNISQFMRPEKSDITFKNLTFNDYQKTFRVYRNYFIRPEFKNVRA